MSEPEASTAAPAAAAAAAAAAAPAPAISAAQGWTFEPLFKIGTAGAGLTALAVLIGFAFERSYFSALGVEWYLPNVSAASSIQMASTYLLLMAGCAWFAAARLLTGASLQKFDKYTGIVACVAMIPLWAPVFLSSWISTRAAYYCAAAGGLTFIATAGATLGMIYFQTRGQQSLWRYSHTRNLVWIYLVVAAWCPPRISETQVAFDLDPLLSALPKVSMTGGGCPISEARLVHLEGDTALVVQLSASRRPIFQIVKLGQSVTLESTRTWKTTSPNESASSATTPCASLPVNHAADARAPAPGAVPSSAASAP